MNRLIETAFENTHARYSKILNAYYPAHGSTGFTERNLSHNFVVSLQDSLGASSISWFEAPISIQPRKHIDAVVFDLRRKSMFMIESKRFSNPDKKINDIKSDIARIATLKHIDLLEKGLINTTIEHRYGIIFADVWKENDRKSEIYNTWPKCILDNRQPFIHKKRDFNNLAISSEWKKNYCLLIVAFEI